MSSNSRSGGSQMYAYDVNGDGKAGHHHQPRRATSYGLAWFEQTNEGGGGVEGWTKHVIVGEKPEDNPQGVMFTQPHAIWMQDMNGDGLLDIVTGKRFWAHGPTGDIDPNAPAVLYWFELKRTGKNVEWIAHLIDDNSGVGTEVMAGDLNGDGKPDVVVGNKKRRSSSSCVNSGASLRFRLCRICTGIWRKEPSGACISELSSVREPKRLFARSSPRPSSP